MWQFQPFLPMKSSTVMGGCEAVRRWASARRGSSCTNAYIYHHHHSLVVDTSTKCFQLSVLRKYYGGGGLVARIPALHTFSTIYSKYRSEGGLGGEGLRRPSSPASIRLS